MTSANRPTVSALFRSKHFERALRKTSTRVQVGWDLPAGQGRTTTEDEWFAKKLHTWIREERLSGTRRTVHTLQIPPWHKRHCGLIHQVARLEAMNGGVYCPRSGSLQFSNWPDPVLGIVIDGGREVFVHSFLHRLVQRQWLSVIEPLAEAVLLPCAHGYRPGRSRFTALASVRAAARRGFVHAVVTDVANCFQSIRVPVVESVLRDELPQVGARLRALALWFMHPYIRRRPNHPYYPGKSEPPRGQLLQGSVVAPTLCNLVLNTFLDTPLVSECSDVSSHRFADDVIVLGQTPSAAEKALTLAATTLAIGGLSLNPTKTTSDPVDLRYASVKWLGKEVGKGGVRTPDATLRDLVARVLAENVASHEFRQRCYELLAELYLDKQSRVNWAYREMKRTSPTHALGFEQILRTYRRRLPRDPEPDELDDHMVAHGEPENGKEANVAA